MRWENGYGLTFYKKYTFLLWSCISNRFLPLPGFSIKFLSSPNILSWNHFIFKKELWKDGLKSGNLLEQKEAKQDPLGGGGVKHLRVHAGMKAN